MTNKIQNYFTILKEFISKISGKVNSHERRIDSISEHIIDIDDHINYNIDPDIENLKTNTLKKDDIKALPNGETYTLYINNNPKI